MILKINLRKVGTVALDVYNVIAAKYVNKSSKLAALELFN